MSRRVTWSKTVTFFENDWHEGNVPIMGPRTHAAWLCTSVFDGARAFDGVTPDLDLHCARVNESVKAMCLKPLVSTETWIGLARDGCKRFERNAELYIRPMYWAEDAAGGAVRPDPETTRWCLTLYIAPLPEPSGTAITLSPFRRPTRETAPLEAKAGCLYPHNARALIEARSRGFDNCIMCDMLGNVAELGTANIFMAKDGVVFTPAANGTFLSGITRARVIALLRRRRDRRRGDAALFRFPIGRRDFFHRQLHQSLAGHAHRRPRFAARPVLPQGAGALLAIRARDGVSGQSSASGPRTVSSVGIERPRMS